MLFWFKKKEVVLDCFTHLVPNYEYLKIDKAAKFVPDWYKKLGRGNFTDPYMPLATTMKKCRGFLDYFTNSFAVPMWEYAHFRVDSESVEIRITNATVGNHSPNQYKGFLDNSYHHIKIETPWVIQTKSKVKFIQTYPTWCYNSNNRPERFLHTPGVVDFYYQNSTNINGFLKKPERGEPAYVFTFEIGTPISFYTPLESVKVKLKHHLIDRSEFSQKCGLIPSSPGPNRLSIAKRLM